MSKATKKKMNDLRDEFGIACPECKAADTVLIEISCLASLTAEGSEPISHHEWGDGSLCICEKCGHRATVAEFSIADDKAVRS